MPSVWFHSCYGVRIFSTCERSFHLCLKCWGLQKCSASWTLMWINSDSKRLVTGLCRAHESVTWGYPQNWMCLDWGLMIYHSLREKDELMSLSSSDTGKSLCSQRSVALYRWIIDQTNLWCAFQRYTSPPQTYMRLSLELSYGHSLRAKLEKKRDEFRTQGSRVILCRSQDCLWQVWVSVGGRQGEIQLPVVGRNSEALCVSLSLSLSPTLS